MCFKRKKKMPAITGNKFHEGDKVGFHHNGELLVGYIYAIKLDANNQIVYDVQMGGECPYFKNGIPEEKLHLRK